MQRMRCIFFCLPGDIMLAAIKAVQKTGERDWVGKTSHWESDGYVHGEHPRDGGRQYCCKRNIKHRPKLLFLSGKTLGIKIALKKPGSTMNVLSGFWCDEPSFERRLPEKYGICRRCRLFRIWKVIILWILHIADRFVPFFKIRVI